MKKEMCFSKVMQEENGYDTKCMSPKTPSLCVP